MSATFATNLSQIDPSAKLFIGKGFMAVTYFRIVISILLLTPVCCAAAASIWLFGAYEVVGLE